MNRISLVFSLLMISMICLAAGSAFADVSNQIIVGFEGDSTEEVTQSVGGVSNDLTDTFKTENSLFVLQYTRFLKPLKEDGTPIELRRFLQHPSALFAGLVSTGQTVEDSTIPEKTERSASVLVFGGEHYFPTNTGLFLNLGFGGGTLKETVSGIDQPERNIDVNTYEMGVRQYVAPALRLHLVLSGEKTHTYTENTAPASIQDTTQNVLLLGAQGVIRKKVGLSFEAGGGSRTDTLTGSADEEFDVGRLNFAISVYPGKKLSFKFEMGADSAEQTGLPSGVEYTESRARITLSATCWFTERFGMHFPIYSETRETKDVAGSLETKTTEKNSGLGVYAGFRF